MSEYDGFVQTDAVWGIKPCAAALRDAGVGFFVVVIQAAVRVQYAHSREDVGDETQSVLPCQIGRPCGGGVAVHLGEIGLGMAA